MIIGCFGSKGLRLCSSQPTGLRRPWRTGTKRWFDSSTVGGVGSRWWAIQTRGRLGWRDRVVLLVGQTLPALAQSFVDRTFGRKPDIAASQASRRSRPAHVPREQDTPLSREAVLLCREASGDDDWLYNHCRRTFELGDLLASRSPKLTVDLEILFVAAMLHDIGLAADAGPIEDEPSPTAMIPTDSPCFAVRGAALAERLAVRHYWTQPRTYRLAEAVSLHLNVLVSVRRGIEAHLLNAASAYDTIRFGSGRLRHEGETVAQIEKKWPRTGEFCPLLCSAWDSATESDTRVEFLTQHGDFPSRVMATCQSSSRPDDSRRGALR